MRMYCAIHVYIVEESNLWVLQTWSRVLYTNLEFRELVESKREKK